MWRRSLHLLGDDCARGRDGYGVGCLGHRHGGGAALGADHRAGGPGGGYIACVRVGPGWRSSGAGLCNSGGVDFLVVVCGRGGAESRVGRYPCGDVAGSCGVRWGRCAFGLAAGGRDDLGARDGAAITACVGLGRIGDILGVGLGCRHCGEGDDRLHFDELFDF